MGFLEYVLVVMLIDYGLCGEAKGPLRIIQGLEYDAHNLRLCLTTTTATGRARTTAQTMSRARKKSN